jgi:hypothetical protein
MKTVSPPDFSESIWVSVFDGRPEISFAVSLIFAFIIGAKIVSYFLED